MLFMHLLFMKIPLMAVQGPTRSVPAQLTAPPHSRGESKPRIVRVMADGQEQELVISAAPSSSSVSMASQGEQLQMEVSNPCSLSQPQVANIGYVIWMIHIA